MAKPMYVWNGSAWEAVAPTVPESPITYQASAPSSPSTGDIWVDSDGDVGTFDRQLVRYRFVASGGETSLSGVDANGFTLAYVPGAEQVYLNGVLLVRTSDYTATNGTSITALSPALAANDVVEVFAYNSFNLANTYTKAEVDGSLALKSDVSATGLVHINTTSFSAVASQSFNNVFSATYDHYKIFGYVINSAGAGYFDFRLRVSGSDNSSNNYKWAQFYQRFQTSNSLVTDYTNALVSAWRFGGTNTTDSYVEATIFNPFNTKNTAYMSKSIDTFSSTDGFRYDMGGATSVTTSYDGFSIFPSSGTITGTIRIYGVKN